MNHNPYPFNVFGGPDGGDVGFNDDTPETVFDAANAIEELALMDAEEIRHKLINLGVKGEQDGVHSCPLAVYLEERLGLDSSFISVEASQITMDLGGDGYTFFWSDYQRYSIKTFVIAFDEGEYPELIQGSET